MNKGKTDDLRFSLFGGVGGNSNPRYLKVQLISSLLVILSRSGSFVLFSGRLVCAESRLK